MEERFLDINKFKYDLPDERIALFPLEDRDSSKLLVYKNGIIQDKIFKDITSEVSKGDFLVFNNSKVIQARLYFDSGRSKPIEILLLKPANKNSTFETALCDKQNSRWECMVGNSRKWKEKFLTSGIKMGDYEFNLTAAIVDRTENFFVVEFRWDNLKVCFGEILDMHGSTPLPPYIKRNICLEDKERYQTVYAKQSGSVAAPTAGLHFTNKVFSEFKNKYVDWGEVTLHVGAGTFKPVTTQNVFDHKMHSELVSIKKELMLQLCENYSNLISVGTTSLRSLESLKILGTKLINGNTDLIVTQQDGFNTELTESDVHSSFLSVLDYIQNENLNELSFETSLMIYPGFQIKTCKALITNFHQPGSTLLMLISSFIGDEWKRIYNHALKSDYRFLSYGDSSILFRPVCRTFLKNSP